MKRKCSIIWSDTVDSTNNEVLKLLQGTDFMSVSAARCQTAGRGQRGNRWQADKGLNLTFSIGLHFGSDCIFPAIRQFSLSKATALSLTDFLKAEGITARIKWPNDIYVGDKKICGILIENSLKGLNLNTSVIGIGLNVNQTVFPSDLPNPTSVKLENGRSEPDLEALLEKYMEFFEARLEQALENLHEQSLENLNEQAPEGTLDRDYFETLYGEGNFLTYKESCSEEIFSARITGIGPTGTLMLEEGNGRKREYSFKEIELILS